MMYIVQYNRCLAPDEEKTVVAAFDRKSVAQLFIDTQEDARDYHLLTVPLNPPLAPVTMPWEAIIDRRDGKMRLLERMYEVCGEHTQDHIGLVQCECLGMQMRMWFLATDRDAAKKRAYAIYENVRQREAVGGFKFICRPVFAPTGDVSRPLEFPFYDFENGRLIVPEQGAFALPDEEMLDANGQLDEKRCRRVTGKWLYNYRIPDEPMSHYDGFYSLLKKEQEGKETSKTTD